MNEELDAFRREVEWELAFGSLADLDLPVVNGRGERVVLAALAEERLRDLFRRLEAADGFANVLVRDGSAMHRLSVSPGYAKAPSPGSGEPEDLSQVATVRDLVRHLRTHASPLPIPVHAGASIRIEARLESVAEPASA